MSFTSDCPGCMAGDHDRHVREWGLRPGLIGGSWCGCRGDCEQRSTRAYEQMMQGATKEGAQEMSRTAKQPESGEE